MKAGVLRISEAMARSVREQAQAAGRDTPDVRGADWQMATVATATGTGTITTTEGIVARRLDTYPAPQVGDLIQITQASTGGWLATGRIVPTAGDGWQPLTLAGTWVWNGGATDAPPAARFTTDGLLELSGMIKGTAVNASAGASLGTLPAGLLPTYWIRGIAPTSVVLNYARIDINPTGAITMVNGSVNITNTAWIDLNPIRGRAR